MGSKNDGFAASPAVRVQRSTSIALEATLALPESKKRRHEIRQQDRADSSEVEDRRGGGFSGRGVGFGIGGLGVVGTLIVVALRLLGGSDPTVDDSAAPVNDGPAPPPRP